MDVKRSDLLRKWLMLTTMVFSLFFLVMFTALTVLAESRDYEVLDMAERQVKYNGEGEILASSDIVFKFKDLSEPDMPISDNRVRDWLFCERESVNDRDIYTPVRNGVFRLNVREDTEVSFVWIDRVSGETAEEKNIPEVFRIKYDPSPDMEIKTEFEYEEAENEGEGIVILKGDNPVLKLFTPEYGRSYLTIDDGKKTETKEIEKRETEIVFKEGSYRLSLWSEDGWGIRYDGDLPFNEFTYDASAPVIIRNDLKSPDRNVFTSGGKLCSGESVIVSPEAEDQVSSVEYYIFHVLNSYYGSEYEAYGDELQINPCFMGNVSVRAVDSAGNISDEVMTPGIVIDREKPVLKKRNCEEDNKDKYKLDLSFEAEDTLTGIREIKLFINDGLKEEKSCYGEKKAGLSATVDIKELKGGQNKAVLYINDMVGNSSSYEFTLEKEDERKEKENVKEKEKEKNKDKEKESKKHDKAPEMFLKGFNNFQKGEESVRFEAGIDNDFPEEGRVYIERHDKEGEIANVYEAEPGYISVSDEGNYVVRYIIEHEGNTYEEYGYFTIDRSAPGLCSLKDIDRKSFYSLSIGREPLDTISDYTYVNSRMTLSGREYDGHEIKEAGRYILKLTATDELGHSSEESAEFLIVKRDEGKNPGGVTEEKEIRTEYPLSANKPVLKGKPGETVSAADIYFIDDGISGNNALDHRVSENSPDKNLSSPGEGGKGKTVYRRGEGIIPVIIIAAFVLCIMSTVVLVVNPLMERRG